MGKKINQLAELLAAGAVAGTDLVVVYDSSAGVAKKMTVSELATLLGTDATIADLAELLNTGVDTNGDYLEIYDTDAAVSKKILWSELCQAFAAADLTAIASGAITGASDLILVYDADAAELKSITVTDLLSLAASSLTNWTESTNSGTQSVFTATGAGTNIAALIKPKGNGGFGLSDYGNAKGSYAVDLQIGPQSSTASVAGGLYSAITGGNSNYIGTSGAYSRAGGRYSRHNQYGMDVWANGDQTNSNNGYNQVMRTILYKTSSGTADVEMSKDSTIALRCKIENNDTVWHVSLKLAAVCNAQGDGTALVGEAFAAEYKCLIKNVAGTTSLVGAQQTIGTAISDTNMATTDLTITVDDATEEMVVTFNPPATAGTTGQVYATVLVEIVQQRF